MSDEEWNPLRNVYKPIRTLTLYPTIVPPLSLAVIRSDAEGETDVDMETPGPSQAIEASDIAGDRGYEMFNNELMNEFLDMDAINGELVFTTDAERDYTMSETGDIANEAIFNGYAP